MPPVQTSSRRANGEAIRALREALGHPHGKFAIACLISPGYLSNVEAGKKNPSPEVLSRIGHQLGVSVGAISTVPEMAVSA